MAARMGGGRRRTTVLFVTMIALGLGLVLVTILFANPGCSEARRTLRESRSPSGALVARAVEISPGATVGFKYQVEIGESGPHARWTAVFRSYRVEPFALHWRGEDSLEISVTRTEYWGRVADVHLERDGSVAPLLSVIDGVGPSSR